MRPNLPSECRGSQASPSGRDSDLGNFLRHRRRPRAALEDCRDYLKITTAQLQVAKGILTIPSDYVSVINDEKGEFYCVRKLLADASRCWKNLKTFSEAGVPWVPCAPAVAC